MRMSDERVEQEVNEQPIKSELINGWFAERIDISCPGHAQCLRVDEVLYHEKSEYQDILIFKTETYGNVLVLDGIINCTERDEFSYQEMLSNLALCSHPNPENVLIIGGGDGGIAREVAKHNIVKRIVQCEIDGKVIEACRKYIPSMAIGFDNPKVELFVGDGFQFMADHVNEFDVIITDSSDPIGPAISLFQKEYYQLLFKALKPGGIISSQGESFWIPAAAGMISRLLREIHDVFSIVSYAYTYIPTYTMGQIGFILASKNTETHFGEPLRILTEEEIERMNLRYYNDEVHRASFIMPSFIKKLLPAFVTA